MILTFICFGICALVIYINLYFAFKKFKTLEKEFAFLKSDQLKSNYDILNLRKSVKEYVEDIEKLESIIKKKSKRQDAKD